jgi:hypothetical protein
MGAGVTGIRVDGSLDGHRLVILSQTDLTGAEASRHKGGWIGFHQAIGCYFESDGPNRLKSQEGTRVDVSIGAPVVGFESDGPSTGAEVHRHKGGRLQSLFRR